MGINGLDNAVQKSAEKKKETIEKVKIWDIRSRSALLRCPSLDKGRHLTARAAPRQATRTTIPWRTPKNLRREAVGGGWTN